MTVGQLTTPRLPTSWPFTNQRWTEWSYGIAMCARLSVSARCGIASPHFALDMRLVNASLSNWACESQLIRPYLMSTLTPLRRPVYTRRLLTQLRIKCVAHCVADQVDTQNGEGDGPARLVEADTGIDDAIADFHQHIDQ